MKKSNKKTFIRAAALLIAVLCTLMLFISCGGDQTEKGNGKYGDMQVDIKDFYIKENDIYGITPPSLVVTYTFTNNSDSAKEFGYNFKDVVYQNGVALDADFVYGLENDNQYNAIKPGATVDVAIPYRLTDTTSDIEIEISISGTDKCILSKTFSLTEEE